MNADPSLAEIGAAICLAWSALMLCVAYLYCFGHRAKARD
jgi:hypothetical protein